MGVRNDYRLSTIIVLCKDCGKDVGLYPARHQCNVKRPYLPTLCSTTTNNQWEDVPELIKSPTVTRQASDSSMESGKWNFFRSTVKNEENPTYFDNYATHLKSSSSCNDMKDVTNGKKLWGRMKENEKWKELITDKSKYILFMFVSVTNILVEEEANKSPGKLWSRIIQATMSNPEDDCGPGKIRLIREREKKKLKICVFFKSQMMMIGREKHTFPGFYGIITNQRINHFQIGYTIHHCNAVIQQEIVGYGNKIQQEFQLEKERYKN